MLKSYEWGEWGGLGRVAPKIFESAPVPFWANWGLNWVGLGWDWVWGDWGLGLDNLSV